MIIKHHPYAVSGRLTSSVPHATIMSMPVLCLYARPAHAHTTKCPRRVRLTALLICGPALLSSFSTACRHQPDTTPRELGPPREAAVGTVPPTKTLVFSGTIAIPTPESSTDWLSRPGRIAYDPVSGHLFTADNDRHSISEFDLRGQHVREFGTLGQGPGEIANLGGYAVTATAVYAIDNGNGKLLRFDRAKNDIEETKVDKVYYAIAAVSPDTLLLLPGDDTLFDVFTDDGRQLDGFGARGAIPGPLPHLFDRRSSE